MSIADEYRHHTSSLSFEGSKLPIQVYSAHSTSIRCGNDSLGLSGRRRKVIHFFILQSTDPLLDEEETSSSGVESETNSIVKQSNVRIQTH